MVHYGSDGLFWGHGKERFDHEHSGPNSCWNWEVQKVLSRACTQDVNTYLNSARSNEDEDKMVRCFVRTAASSHNLCVRQLNLFDGGKLDWGGVKSCARKEYGLAMRNLVQTAIAVGECRPIP